ncbi:uncharacterized protein LOC120134937 [Hibiscus syriacus]|uniref:uncharacterized protein LOC120134937 n=1 Tax=Hibiscus syriacus TaxID=106335 RepID=UPI001924E73E|nr:uncharacterized protein LOC120134937 [Hibiscus syriacus]
MSDEGEKTCPLCAEEMDITDQQLKPCKCGYEICVWCWHHIMNMAEKDSTEGRCPACRSAYDKDRIVGTTANCERLVAEFNMERKTKSQKAKSKSSEARKHLSSVRVIQKNLVYIVGLPLNLADEELLQCRDYFGQYGKVLKVSMSRTAAGVIQQFPNNTCSVYITYSKEEEAIRCIQSVHGFNLDGRPLKACFGTTKYCHAWLRNVPCTNPDCLYLHEIGPQEDSFTKDEIISAYTRVQQITGATNNMQRRPGNMLPPPVDDYCPNSSASAAKPIASAPKNATVTVPKSSPPNGSYGRSITLPAGVSWGMRASNQPQLAGLACSNGPVKQNSNTVSSALPKPSKQNTGLDCQTTALDKPSSSDGVTASKSLISQLSPKPSSNHDHQGTNMPSTITNSFDHGGHTSISSGEKVGSISSADGNTSRLCSDMSTLTLDRSVLNGHSEEVRPSSSASEHGTSSSPSSQGLQQCYTDYYREPLSSATAGISVTSPNVVFVSKEQPLWEIDAHTQAVENINSEVEEDVLSFDNQRLKDPEVISRSSYVPNSPIPLHLADHTRSHSLQHGDAFGAVNLNSDTLIVDNKALDSSCLIGADVSSWSNRYLKYISSSIGSDITTERHSLLSNEEKGKQLGRFLVNAESNATNDTGEINIISNILSLDFDTGESLTSPQNLVKLLGDGEKQQPNTLKLSSSRKTLNNNQSRFSFARQEDSKNFPADVESSFSVFGQMPQNRPSQDLADSRDSYLCKIGVSDGLASCNFEESNNFSSSPIFSSKLSAPPGFSVRSRAPPPGFSSIERVNHGFDSTSGNHLMDSSSLLRYSYQAPQSGGIGGPGDIEFIDPAILAVGKGIIQGGLNDPGLDMRSNFAQQLGPNENEARFQLMMQRSLSPHQNLRYDVGDSFSCLNDSYGISSRLMDQSQVNNMSPFAQLSLQQSRNTHNVSNGHWDRWNEIQGGNGLGVAELLRNERLGFNKFYSGYEGSKYRMPTSDDLYNRTFGM